MSQKSNKEEFLGMLRDHKKLIYKVSSSYCKNPDDRKDLIQEIIIQLWTSFSKYNDQYKLSTWIYRISLNVAISFYRKEAKRRDTASSLNENIILIVNEDESRELEHNVEILYQCINKLNELNKALMILYLDNNSYREIAEILGITETNVATKINRIKQQLKNHFTTLNLK
jgi:RNA polymerase sigma-70 factor (ECF subfamily)